MINKKLFQKLKSDYDQNNQERRQIISQSNIALHDSKRAIFSLHRFDIETAQENLNNIEKILANLEKKFGLNRLKDEGAYKAALEEYVEAKLFFLFQTKQKIDKIKELKIDYDSYLGGLCDFTGELVRLGTNMAAKGKIKEFENASQTIEDIMAELINFDLTSYLRTKYDQARNNLRKIEQISYDINIRK